MPNCIVHSNRFRVGESATFLTTRSKYQTDLASWTSQNGLLTRVQSLADQVQAAYETLAVMSSAESINLVTSLGQYQILIQELSATIWHVSET
jgi:hypothetical protein